MNKIIWLVIGIAVIAVVVAGIFWYVGTRKESDEEQTTAATTTQATSAAEPTNGETEAKIETTQLEAVGGYTGSGTATRSFDGKTFNHTVTADIGDPAPGKFYEGWLVQSTPTLKFFSTGKLVKEDGKYTLDFTAEQNYPDYPEVVITEETEANGLDGNPETHVLEGSF
jgi:hypothetical protein